MGERLAIEAKRFALHAGMREALVVSEVEIHTVEDPEREGACGEQAKPKARQHRQTLASMCCVEIVGEIGSTHYEALDAPGACRNFFSAEYAKRSLHRAPNHSSPA